MVSKTIHLGGIKRLKVLTGPDNEHPATTDAFLRMVDPERNEEGNNILLFTFREKTRTLYARLNDANAYQDDSIKRVTMPTNKNVSSHQPSDKQSLVMPMTRSWLKSCKRRDRTPHPPANICATHSRHGGRHSCQKADACKRPKPKLPTCKHHPLKSHAQTMTRYNS